MVHVALVTRWVELSIQMDVNRDVEDIWIVVEGPLTAVACSQSV